MKRIFFVTMVAFFALSFLMGAVATNEVKAEEKPWEGQTIRVVSFMLAGLDEVQNQVGEFEKQYNIKVKWDMLAMGTMREKMMIDFNAGTKTIDVGMSSIHLTPTHLAKNNIEPLDDYIKGPLAEPDLLEFDDFYPAAIEVVTFPKNGLKGPTAIFGLPYHCETQGLMYRKSIYKKYNLSVPKTLEEYLNNAKVITEGEKPKMYGIAWRALRSPQIMWAFTQVLRAYGGKYFVDYPNDLTPALDTKEFKDALTYFVNSFDYAPPGSRSWAYTEVITGLQSGLVAQALDDLMYARYLEDKEKSVAPDDWGYGVLPLKEGLTYADVKFGPGIKASEHWVINADISDEKKQAAFKFIQWATSKKVMSALAQKGVMKGFIARKSQYELVKDQDWAKAFVANLEHASKFSRPKLPEWPKVSEQIQIVVSGAVIGDFTPEEAAERAQKECTRILKTKILFRRIRSGCCSCLSGFQGTSNFRFRL